MSPLSWLPPLVPHDGTSEIARYLDVIHEHFLTDFVRSRPRFPNRRWAVKRHPEVDGRHATFWHIVSSGPVEAARALAIERCERIRWPRPVIDAFLSGRVRCWKNKRGTSMRILIATLDFSYLVVLEDREEFVMLWTAYPVDREHSRRKLEKDWAAYRAANCDWTD